ncbi:MAG: T9SS C-terminal target domain-containing protein [Bacteroidetes bacterium]|nr:MAG: T9SS C-terminal target domain-containing protein [Bacteroidota bacterium]
MSNTNTPSFRFHAFFCPGTWSLCLLLSLLGMPRAAMAQFCSGTTLVSASSGTIHDGSGASNYANNSNCFWLIEASGAAYISLVPTYLQLEDAFDYVNVYDGNSTAAPLLATYTGGEGNINLPPSVSSTGPYMLLHFVSNVSVTLQGWSFDFFSATALPDLLPSLFSLSPGSSTPGGSVFASGRVDNFGAGPSVIHTRAGYYLSSDAVFDGSDFLLGSDDVEPLSPGNGTPEDETLNIPGWVSPGGYYIIYRADMNQELTESNETNNYTSLPLTIVGLPDLIPHITSIDRSTVAPGEDVLASGHVENASNAAAGINTRANYYLSTNTSWEGSDPQLGSDDVEPLGPWASSPESEVLTIPAGTAPGNYYILWVADANGELNESNEGNNVSWVAITVTGSPDLLVQNQQINPVSTTAGGVLTANCTVTNVGSAYAGVSKLGYYLSANTSLDASDSFLGEDAVSDLAAGNSSPEDQQLTIPPGTPAGSYYILFVADYLNAVSEGNESNNVAVASLSIQAFPDLNPQAPSVVPNVVVAGNTTQASAVVHNLGGQVALASKLAYYLSTNTTFDGADLLLGIDDVPVLNGGGTYNVSQTLSIPAGTAAGNYYILFFADYQQVVSESNENNNVAAAFLQVQQAVSPPVADFSASALSVCLGDAVNFTDLSTNTPSSWNWSFSPASVSYLNGTHAGSQHPVVQFDAPGSYSVSLTAANAGGADTETKNAYIQVSALLNVDVSISASTTQLCQGMAVNFTANATHAGSSPLYQWKLNGSNVGSNAPSYQLANPANGDVVSLELTSSLNCASPTVAVSNSIALTVHPLPTVSLAPFPVLQDTDPLYSLSEGSPAGGSYSGTGVSGNTFDPSVGAGTYLITYTYTDANGCTATASRNLEVQANVFVPFSWTPTNQSGILIGQAQIDGVPAAASDWIAAFDQAGNCAGAAQLILAQGIAYINLPIYGDDPTTLGVDEGINSGESFRLVLYDASETEYLDYPHSGSVTLFTQWANTNGTPIPAYNDVNQVYNFVHANEVTDQVSLKAGWNLISLDVQPSDSAVGAVFANLMPGNLQYVTGFEQGSLIYDPNGLPFFNTLNHLKRGCGYWVKVGSADMLSVSGTPIDPAYKKDLFTGWNLVGYLPQTTSTPATFYSQLIAANKLLYITGFDEGTTIFNPNGPPFLNTLNSLQNGRGYWLRVNANIAGTDYRQAAGVQPTPVYMFVNGSSELRSGGVVEVVDEHEQLVGRMQVLPGGYLMTTPLYGDDPFTPEVDGLRSGSRLHFRYGGRLAGSTLVFDPSGEVQTVHLAFESGPVAEAYPNPFSDALWLRVELPVGGELEVQLYDMRGVAVRELRQHRPAGGQEMQLPTGQLPEGIYQLRASVNGQPVLRQRLLRLR